MCRLKAPWAAPKDSTFSTWTAPKDHLFKNIHLFVPLFRHGLFQKTPFLKVYVSLLFLVPPPPPLRFSLRGRSESPPPPFSVRGRSVISPNSPNSGRHIYIYIYIYIYKPYINHFSYISTPHGFVKQRSFLMSFPSFFFLSLSVCLSVKQWSFINKFSFVFLSLSIFLSTLF